MTTKESDCPNQINEDENEEEPMGIPDFQEGGIVREGFLDNLNHIAISGVNNLINEPQPVISTTPENFIRTELNNLIEAVYRPNPESITRCMLNIRSKPNRKLDTDYPHFCFKCKKPLFFYELLNVNQNMDRDHLEKLWKSKYVKFYCCDCYQLNIIERSWGIDNEI